MRRPASRALTICEAAQISTSASQMVAMPCSGTASTPLVDRSRSEIDRRQALRLGEREKGIGHQVLRIPRGKVARGGRGRDGVVRDQRLACDAHLGQARTSAPLLAGVGNRRGLALGRQHSPDARIGGRVLSAKVRPRLEIIERVDDAAADLPVLGDRCRRYDASPPYGRRGSRNGQLRGS